MTNEISESKSILRQLLLSGDESDSPEISERKRKIKDDNETSEKRGKFLHEYSEVAKTAVSDRQSSHGQLVPPPTVTFPSQFLHCDQIHPEQRRFFFDANEIHLQQQREKFFLNQFEMIVGESSNDSSEPKEDDLPVTHEMRRHYLQQLRERLTHDAIGLPT